MMSRGEVMPLKYPQEWKYGKSTGEISNEAQTAFVDLIDVIAEGIEDPQDIFEAFKFAYGNVNWSSNASFARGDMQSAMRGLKDNAARYVASFYAAIEKLKKDGVEVPDVSVVNQILVEHEIPFEIDAPNLKLRDGDLAVVPEDAPQEILARGFVKGEVIGKGGFGVVYRVTRKTTTGEYHLAMKEFNPSSFQPKKEVANRRFTREIHLLQKLQHRAIVPLFEAGMTAEQVPYILMPLVEGKNLRDALEGAKSEKVFRIFDEILFGLEFAHSRSILHRDLRPENILVRDTDEQPQILDFGAGFFLDEADEVLTTKLIGTEAYIPEEVRLNPKIRDVKQDVYACGIMLYEVIARHLPRLSDYEPIKDQVDGYDGIDKIIEDATAAPRKRIETIAEMRKRLKELAIYLSQQRPFIK